MKSKFRIAYALPSRVHRVPLAPVSPPYPNRKGIGKRRKRENRGRIADISPQGLKLEVGFRFETHKFRNHFINYNKIFNSSNVWPISSVG